MRRRPRRRFTNGLAATPSAVTQVTCKLDVSGKVADIVIARQDGSVLAGCGGSDANAVLPGGRNVVLDFTDSRIVQVGDSVIGCWVCTQRAFQTDYGDALCAHKYSPQYYISLICTVAQVVQGKLSSSGSAMISWFSFRTASPDLRTCGLNVQPTSANATLTTFTAAAGKGLDSATLSCASGRLLTLSAATFAVALPATVSLAPSLSLPACCTPVFTQPRPNVSSADNTCCKRWLAYNPGRLQQVAGATCPCELASQDGISSRQGSCVYCVGSINGLNRLCVLQTLPPPSSGPTP